MSVLVDPFLAIDLSRVEPKVCFKNLKGVSAASLSALAAIAPVMELNPMIGVLSTDVRSGIALMKATELG